MNYCTIQEAWGKNNISNNFKEHMANSNENEEENVEIKYNIEYNNNINDNMDDCNINCDKFILHIKKCKKCRNKIKKYFKSNMNDLLYTLIEENKDIIIIILITIFILLFINLVNNITKN